MARQREDGVHDLARVLVLVQINRLEEVVFRASELLAALQELGNVLHL